MATRTYCDLCGNTIHTANRFCFGPDLRQEEEAQAQMYKQAVVANVQARIGNGGGGGSGIGALHAPYPSTQSQRRYIPTISIDLCDGCQDIWMARVKKITAASDTDA